MFCYGTSGSRGIPVVDIESWHTQRDQGTNFMSHIIHNLCIVLKIWHLQMTVYYPQKNRLVERFNGILKNMLHQCAQEEPRRWDLLAPPLVFAVREAP